MVQRVNTELGPVAFQSIVQWLQEKIDLEEQAATDYPYGHPEWWAAEHRKGAYRTVLNTLLHADTDQAPASAARMGEREMAWAGANYPQEHDSTPVDCKHEGAKYHVRDDEGIESISCVDCITDELETELKQGMVWRWEIARLTDD